MALHLRSLYMAAGAAAVLATTALPVPGRAAPSHVVLTPKLDWQTAQALAAEAVRVCAARGFSVTATVVDTSGEQQAVIKGDQAPLQSLSVSYRKAYTAYSYGMAFDKDSTSALVAAKLTGPADGSLATVPQVIFIAGGVTLRTADRTVLGGIGVSGASGGDKDEACAQAAVDKYKDTFR
ncbi:GlcG/HbpS family heme-binding protein [Xanthomonas massiliensis]|uniref:GlcG/HbpS family heme-binding protein n=1 Tax=Xanthomonas massiliensis TaxID=1720302 RepID=UPI00082637DF|nr:heme-binding protein [Xanthomonas massiliensis]